MTPWIHNKINSTCNHYSDIAKKRQAELTKPSGALGELENLAIRIAAMQKTEYPSVERIWISVFAADHGIAEEPVSAFPQIVTTEMVNNFSNSGAAINVLSRFINAHFEIIDVGLLNPIANHKVIIERAGSGTQNFIHQPAMNDKQLDLALNAGKSAVIRCQSQHFQLFIGGEMGIGNTTSASALAAKLTGMPIEELTGLGTGISSHRVNHKIKLIKKAISFHDKHLESPLNVLQYLGGFEIAALVGAYLFAAQQEIPIVVDGFIASVAALVAAKINPDVINWMFFGHLSQEKGHKLLLEHLKVEPLLNLKMRLGEGSGAAASIPLLQMACKLHNDMATFKQADITK